MSAPDTLASWLVGRGLTPQEADLWGDFVIDALELVDEAYDLLCTPDEWLAFVDGCHGPKPTEPDITSGLGDRMKRLWASAAIDSGRDRLSVAYESPTPGDDAHGIYKTKADFRVERKFEAGYCAAFVLEAKGLRIPSDVSKKYLAIDGIGCFVDRSPPYTADAIAGMLGYAYKKYTSWEPSVIAALPIVTKTHRHDIIAVNGAGRTAIASDHSRSAIGLSLDVTVLHSVLNFEFA